MKLNFRAILRTLGFIGLPPVASRDELITFIDSNAAYVSQVTLYTYVKARAGMQFPKLFDNDDFLTSLRIARWHIYGAGVCDLALFAGAQLYRADLASDQNIRAFIKEIIAEVFARNDQQDIDQKRFMNIAKTGQDRVSTADWEDIADGPAAFQSSSDAVFEWAPIADELKNNDEEIVRNSIHLRWIGVRRDLKQVIRPAEILAK